MTVFLGMLKWPRLSVTCTWCPFPVVCSLRPNARPFRPWPGTVGDSWGYNANIIISYCLLEAESVFEQEWLSNSNSKHPSDHQTLLHAVCNHNRLLKREYIPKMLICRYFESQGKSEWNKGKFKFGMLWSRLFSRLRNIGMPTARPMFLYLKHMG